MFRVKCFHTRKLCKISNHFHNILRLFDVLTNLLLTKSGSIRGLLNDLRLGILGNQEKSRKSENPIERQPSVHSPYQNENFVNTSKKPLKSRNLTFPALCYFTWKLELVLNILLITVGRLAPRLFALSQMQIITTNYP